MNKIKLPFDSFLNYLAKFGSLMSCLVGLLPSALILFIGYSYFIQPGMALINEKQTQLAVIQNDVAKGKAVEASEESFKIEFRKTVELFYETSPMIPKESEISNILLGVQSVARRYNVTLTGLNAVKDGVTSANASMLIEREIPVTVLGNYDDVLRFFLDLARQNRILIVRDYSIESAVGKQKESRPVFVSVNFSLLAFHAPPSSSFPTNIPPDLMPEPPPSVNYEKTAHAAFEDQK